MDVPVSSLTPAISSGGVGATGMAAGTGVGVGIVLGVSILHYGIVYYLYVHRCPHGVGQWFGGSVTG
jgi:hypothetical protein